MAAIGEGRKAPSFTLEDGTGQRISLEDFKGKNVVVYFYPKDDTPGCTKEACGFRDLWKELQRAGVVVLGVSADGAEASLPAAL
jgi:thioredoxin-dependent peroxiredoxin